MADEVPPATTPAPPPAVEDVPAPAEEVKTAKPVAEEVPSAIEGADADAAPAPALPPAEEETKPEPEAPVPPVVATTRESSSETKGEESIVESGESQKKSIQPAVSFKEESYFVADLSESERRALDELKKLVQDGAAELERLCSQLPEASTSKQAEEKEGEEEKKPLPTIESTLQEKDAQIQDDAAPTISIWGVPLLKDERTDVVLLKFLRARDFKVKESFEMLKKTLNWRREFEIDKLVEEDLGDDLDKVVFMHGRDREGHPVCYNVYGEFQNKELYGKTFSSQEKRERFLRWRIQFLEKSIRKLLDFRPGGLSSIFQVNDLRNAPGPGKRELRQATRQALQLLQDNYPEFVAKQVFINVPWWYVAFYTMMSPFMTQRTKSKFVFVSTPRSPDTLFKYISPEQVPIQYGGLSVDFCDCGPDFTIEDPATEIVVKPTTKQFVEILVSEKCIIVWELRVVGWDVTYSAEFIPKTKDAYTIVIQKATKMSPIDDPVISGSFKISDLGNIVLTVDNPSFKKRKLIYRYKVLPYSD